MDSGIDFPQDLSYRWRKGRLLGREQGFVLFLLFFTNSNALYFFLLNPPARQGEGKGVLCQLASLDYFSVFRIAFFSSSRNEKFPELDWIPGSKT